MKIIVERKPELKKYPPKEIIQKAKQFNYRTIVTFVKDSIKDVKYGWLDKIIPNYGDLSSYVHGGPLEDKYLLYFNNVEEREKELVNICSLTFLTSNILKQFLYVLLAQLDKEQYSESLKKIDLIINRFTKTA